MSASVHPLSRMRPDDDMQRLNRRGRDFGARCQTGAGAAEAEVTLLDAWMKQAGGSAAEETG